MSEFKFPTEVIDLPSKGLLYPKESPLASGKLEMKYMTAKEEDILTNQNYIQRGIVIDKLLQSLIIGNIDYNQLVTGDQNAVMIAARILGYGKDYEFTYGGEKQVVDLTTLEDKPFNESLITPHVNEFKYTLPFSKADITFKILTVGDEEKIRQELAGLKKINKEANPELSTRLKFMITSVNGTREVSSIRSFVDNQLLARDSKALREYIRQVQPDIDLTVKVTVGGVEEDIALPINVSFFGLTPEHRKYVFDQIHQIVFHGQGGYSFTEVYELPIHIRKYVLHQIKEHYEKLNKQNENPEDLAKKIKGGQIEVPDYSKGKKLSYK